MRLRLWATPLTIGAFIIMSVTGVLMFFHLETGLNKLVHEWGGLVMVGAVGAHIVLNNRALTGYLNRPVARVLIAGGFAVMIGSFFFGGAESDAPDGMRALIMAAGGARIETLAEMAGRDTDSVLAALDAAGHPAGAEVTLDSLTGGDRGAQDEVLGLIFAR